MGVFDSVWFACPHCGAQVEVQSKADPCPYLNNYTPETAPSHIAWDVLNDPQHCRECDGWSVLADPAYPPGSAMPPPKLEVRKVKAPANPRRHHQGFAWWPDGVPFTGDDIEPAPPGDA